MPEALRGRHIAITRPSDQAKQLSKLIKQHEGIPLLFPLIAISPLDDYEVFCRQLKSLEEYDWCIFISSSAVRYGMPRVLKKLPTIPSSLRYAAIGPVTADELKKFGINDTLIPAGRFDSESLLALPEMQTMNHKKVMIIRGVGGRELLAETLSERGAEVTFGECYRRINPQSDTKVLDLHWEKGQLDGIVITSSEAMRHLLDMAASKPWLRSVPLFVNHARIAEAPSQMGLKVTIAEAPGDEAMLRALMETLSH
jgi:uroporphyrinogen-III synthase